MYREFVTSIIVASFFALTCPAEERAEELLDAASTASLAGDSKKSVELLNMAIEKDPSLAGAYYLRGRESFRLGQVRQSVSDLDKYVTLSPKIEPRMWERGISYYYDGEFKKGAKQFELYQTYKNTDVENSVWRFLCMARDVGVGKARKSMLPIENDTRVPMMDIYDLFRGKKTTDDVLLAAKKDPPSESALNRRLFYAHLYIGLFYEAVGKNTLAKKHITLAAKDHKIGHYMWDVANVHANRLVTQKE